MIEVLLLFNKMMLILILDEYNVKKQDMGTLMLTAHVVAEESYRGNIDPVMVLAVSYAESKFVSTAVSRSKCCGIMQVNPRYSEFTCAQLQDRRTCIREGIRKINLWKERYGGAWTCHYNAGVVCDDSTNRYSRYVRYLYGRMKVFERDGGHRVEM